MKIYVGNQPEPRDCRVIEVTDKEFAAVQRLLHSDETATCTVADVVTNTAVTLATDDCGLTCRCALRVIEEHPL